MTIDCLDLEAMTLAATIKGLKARARTIAKKHPYGGEGRPGAHMEIALRRISDAVLFAKRNPEHAIACCWEARHHLNHCE